MGWFLGAVGLASLYAIGVFVKDYRQWRRFERACEQEEAESADQWLRRWKAERAGQQQMFQHLAHESLKAANNAARRRHQEARRRAGRIARQGNQSRKANNRRK